MVSAIDATPQAGTVAHNVREHLEVVMELLAGQSGVTEPAKARLLEHIAEEERGNIQRLEGLLQEHGGTPPRELRLVRDHSHMLLDILEGAIPLPLGQRLLHHMVEEHAELIALGQEAEAPKAPEPEPGPQGPTLRLTLGSLRKGA